MTYESDEQIRAFLLEKTYLQNVSPKTILLYHSCFKAFEGALEPELLTGRVVELRQKGLSPVSVNTYLRHIKTYFLWKGLKWKLPWLKEEQTILETLSANHISSLMAFRSKGVNLNRAHLVALTILDTGIRINECLSLTEKDVDFDNLILKVHGKGGKHRLVPFSQELRKRLYRQCRELKGDFVFGTRNATKVSVRNIERDFMSLARSLNVPHLAPHQLRHTFAVSWLRRGGDIYMLSRILGHSSINTTTIYLRSLGIQDLKDAHRSLSPLSNDRRCNP